MKKYIEMLLKVEPKYPIVLRFIDGTELTFDSIFGDIISDKDNDTFIELKLKELESPEMAFFASVNQSELALSSLALIKSKPL